MFVPVWTDQTKNNFELQDAKTPAIQWRRMMLKSPTVEDLKTAYEKLMEEDIPKDATIEFVRWNAPDTNWYIHVSWQEAN